MSPKLLRILMILSMFITISIDGGMFFALVYKHFFFSLFFIVKAVIDLYILFNEN